MIKRLIILCFLLFPLISVAQIGSQKYGGPGNQSGYRIRSTKDNGFFVAGSTDTKGPGNGDYWAVRFDKTGKALWDSAYGSPDVDFLWSIEPTRDNGALLAGYSGPQYGASGALMYKIDSVGRIVKRYEVDYAKADHAHWFKELKDGSYYWAGHTDSKADPNGDMILQKLDKNFNVIWEKIYDGGLPEHCHVGAVTPDNGVILLGHNYVTREKFWAVRVDSNGKKLWDKTFSSDPANNDSPYDVAVTPEGNYAFFGYSGDYQTVSSAWLLVVDPNGNILIDKHYNTDVTFIYGGIPTADSGFVLAGYSQLPSDANTHLYVLKTDKKGNVQWQKNYGDTSAGYSVIQRGKQYVIAGETYQTEDHLDDLYIVVLDSAGNPALLDTMKTIDSVKKTIALADLKLNDNAHLPQIDNNKPLVISWTQTGDLKTAVDVSVSLDSGKTWQNINKSVPTDVSSTSWTTPAAGYFAHVFIRVASTITPAIFLQSDFFAIGTAAGVNDNNASNEYSISNYPNPFATETKINFYLPDGGYTKITVLDELGRVAATLVSENINAGSYSIPFDAAKLSNGIYTYVLESGAKKLTGKMSIVK